MRERNLVVLDAPSNLGLRPPEPGTVPGVYKLAGALRDQRLLPRVGARDGGVVTPPRYRPEWSPGSGVRNEAAITSYSYRLADRVGSILADGAFPLVLGGDCSILLGNALALRRLGRFGLVFVDGHLDFRHPGNAEAVGAAAGEDLALVTGRGDVLANLDRLAPLVRDEDVVAIGSREEDEHGPEVARTEITLVDAADLRRRGAEAVAAAAVERLARPGLDGFWIHLDVDVLDAELMPAVDTPEPGGLAWDELEALLRGLVASERATGLELTIFDPDLDEGGSLARRLANAIVAAFAA